MTKAKPDYLDFDGDNNTKESMRKALRDKKSKSVKEGLIGGQTKIDVAAPYGKLTSADFKELRKGKKKKIKEGYSNWREDLIEIADKIPSKDREQKIVEKQVNNKIEINPKLDLGERVEQLGGTLLEISEIEDFEGVFDDLSESEIFLLSDQLIGEVVEEFFYECLEEGYDLGEVEDTLLESLEISSTLLNEENDDTKVKSDRLEKVKTAVKNTGKKLVRGVGYTAGLAVRGAKAVGRELKAGYGRGRDGDSGSSSSSDSSRSSGSSSSSGGSSSGSGSSRPGLLGRIGSALKSGLKRVVRGAGYATGLVARGAKATKREFGAGYERGSKGKGKEKPSAVHSKSGVRSASPRSGIGGGKRIEVAGERKKEQPVQRVSVRDVTSPKSKAPEGTSENPRVGKPASTPVSGPSGAASTPSKKPAPKPQAKTTKVPAKTSEPDEGLSARHRAADERSRLGDLEYRKKIAALRLQKRKLDISPQDIKRAISNIKEDYWISAANEYKEEYNLLEKAESEQQQKIFGLALSVKRGQTPRSEVSDRVLKIVDGMSEKEIRKFAKTKHEGIPHKVEAKEEVIRQELIARMINKIEEQSGVYVDEAKLPSSMKKGKKTRESKLLKLTDCDDCTHDQRHPDAAKIDVVNPEGEKTHSLTPGEFAKHQLPSGHKYGFDQFRKTKIVKDTTKPNKRIVNFLNREDYSVIDERIRRYPDQEGVTARGSMDDNRGFTQDMKSRIGVKNLKAVHFVGDIPTGTGPEKKATVAKHIVKKHPDAKEVHFVDDHPGNVKAVTDTLAKPGKTVKGKVGRTRETGPKVKGFVARPATKAKGTVKVGEVDPVRLGGEGRGGNRGIRSNTSPSGSPKETQRRRKQQKMGEAVDVAQTREKSQNPSAINQVLQAKAKADSAERELANKQRMATQKGVNLSSISS